MTLTQKHDRLLNIAWDRLALHPNAYLRFLALHGPFCEKFPAFFFDDFNQVTIACLDPASALREFDRSAVAFVDRWASENIDPPSPRVAPILPMHAAWHDAAVPPMGVTTATRALHAPAPASATIKSKSKETPAWLDKNIDYLAQVCREKKCATAKALFKALEKQSTHETPVQKGSGHDIDKLFFSNASSAIAFNRFRTFWSEIKARAAMR